MWRALPLFLLILGSMDAALPPHTSFVIVSDSAPPSSQHVRHVRSADNKSPHVYALNVRSDVRMRYSRTRVSSKIGNPDTERAQEVVFQVTVPDTAFVSAFIMEVAGQLMHGEVRERQQAKREYHQAVQEGRTAGHVATNSVRDSNNVRIAVNVEAGAKATFNLTYEELLTRRKSRYELVINLFPEQVVREMSVDVFIDEPKGIVSLVVPSFREANIVELNELQTPVNEDARVDWSPGGKQAHVSFAPTPEDQRRLAGQSLPGLAGQFVVRYDVQRTDGAGEVLVTDTGYFAHFFAPPELQSLRKHVIFVLDLSGSMRGRKLEQLIDAMDSILSELQPEHDFFNIIEFSDEANVLDFSTEVTNRIHFKHASVQAFPATKTFVTRARATVRKMSLIGGTNLYEALEASLAVAGTATSTHAPIVIFLTDGQATVGHTNSGRIIGLLETRRNVPVLSLAFGTDADFALLKRISTISGGFARKIYEAADASLQLRDFYQQVNSPLLTNVTFSYPEHQVASVTRRHFAIYFDGTEIVVAGRLHGARQPLRGEVYAVGADEAIAYHLEDAEDVPDSFMERLWAFLTIRQLLEEMDAEIGDHEAAGNKARDLALKYAFVTPLTSLIVVRRDQTDLAKTKQKGMHHFQHEQMPGTSEREDGVEYDYFEPDAEGMDNTAWSAGHCNVSMSLIYMLVSVTAFRRLMSHLV